LLALAGGVAGLVIGWGALQLLQQWAPAQAMSIRGAGLHPVVLAVSMLVTIFAAIVVGMVPARRAGSVDAQEVLRGSGRGLSMGPSRHRFLQGAVVVQMALALVLLLGSVITVRSLGQLLDADAGFQAAGVTSVQLALPGGAGRYGERDAVVSFYRELEQRIAERAGVDAAGVTMTLPLSDMLRDSSPFAVVGRTLAEDAPRQHADLRVATTGYFRAMGIPLIRGRFFEESDHSGSALVALIDEQLANEYFPGEDPIGRQISQGEPAEIIGIVGSVRQEQLTEAHKAGVYYSHRQFPTSWGALVVRSELPLESVVGIVRSSVAELDPQVPVFDVRTMDDRVEGSVGGQRLALVVLGAFAGVALLLAVLGVYGVVSYGVTERTQEFGIRLALGAEAGDVVRLVLRRGAVMAFFGVVLGAIIYVAGARVLTAVTYGVSARDPGMLVGCAAVILVAAILSCYIPARRAARVEPTIALRSD
jgi:putative ABC transport system permease protein